MLCICEMYLFLTIIKILNAYETCLVVTGFWTHLKFGPKLFTTYTLNSLNFSPFISTLFEICFFKHFLTESELSLLKDFESDPFSLPGHIDNILYTSSDMI